MCVFSEEWAKDGGFGGLTDCWVVNCIDQSRDPEYIGKEDEFLTATPGASELVVYVWKENLTYMSVQV